MWFVKFYAALRVKNEAVVFTTKQYIITVFITFVVHHEAVFTTYAVCYKTIRKVQLQMLLKKLYLTHLIHTLRQYMEQTLKVV